MTRHQSYPRIWILKAEKTEDGPSLIVNYQLEDSEIKIRFGVDAKTYSGIKKVIQERWFEKALLSDYDFRLLLLYRCWQEKKPKRILYFFKRNIETKMFSGTIEVLYKKQTKDISFNCSELFASNIEWLKAIKSVEELRHLTYVG